MGIVPPETSGTNLERRQLSLTPQELTRLRMLATLSVEEIAALAQLGTGVVTAGRVRRFTVYLLATIGAAATALLAVANVLNWWRQS